MTMLKVEKMPDFYIWVILLNNHSVSEEIGEKQLSVFDSRVGQISPYVCMKLFKFLESQEI